MRKPCSKKARANMKSKCGVYERTEYHKRIISISMFKLWAQRTKEEKREWTRPARKAGVSSSSIEKMTWKELDNLKINYQIQVPFNNSKFVVDIYIPTWGIIIECNGTYWHNYEIFPKEKIRDESLEKYVNKVGLKVIWLWESDIRKNPKSALLKGLKKLGV